MTDIPPVSNDPEAADADDADSDESISLKWFQEKKKDGSKGKGTASPAEAAASDDDGMGTLPDGIANILKINPQEFSRLHAAALEKARDDYTDENEIERLREIVEGLHAYLHDMFNSKRKSTRNMAGQRLRQWLTLRGDHYEGHKWEISQADACHRQRMRFSAKAAIEAGICDKAQAKQFLRWADAEFGDPEDDD